MTIPGFAHCFRCGRTECGCEPDVPEPFVPDATCVLFDHLMRTKLRRNELAARLAVGAEWIDWIETSVPEELLAGMVTP